MLQGAHMSQIQASQPRGSRPRTGMEEFAVETLNFVVQASFAQGATMHLFDEGAQRVWLGSRGIPGGFRPAYYDEGMWQIDPLANTRARGSSAALIGLQSAEAACNGSSMVRYRCFLRAFGITDAAEIVFIGGGEPIGGMSLLWTNGPDESSQERERVASLRRYLELSFRNALGNTPIGWRK